MSYTKEQTQTIVLVVLVGLVVALGSYMGLIKPNLGRAGEYETNYQKHATELAEQRQRIKASLDAVQRAKRIEERRIELEASLRHGLFGGRLTNYFEKLRRGHGFEFRFTNGLERIEPVTGSQYHELSNRFVLPDCQFYELVRFIQVLETDHPSLRLSDINVSLSSAAELDGRVDASIELRVLGYKDGQDAPWEGSAVDTFKPERRNPFAALGVVEADPHKALRAALAQVHFQGEIEGSLIVRPSPGAATTLVKDGQNISLGDSGQSVRLVRSGRGSFIVHHEDTATYYKLTIHTSGDKTGRVEKVEEFTPQ